jgi:hypothetical protein
MPVSYTKEMRERALKDRKGLYTIEIINANKKPGKFGGKISLQGPAGAEEHKAVSAFILRFIKMRNKLHR